MWCHDPTVWSRPVAEPPQGGFSILRCDFLNMADAHSCARRGGAFCRVAASPLCEAALETYQAQPSGQEALSSGQGRGTAPRRTRSVDELSDTQRALAAAGIRALLLDDVAGVTIGNLPMYVDSAIEVLLPNRELSRLADGIVEIPPGMEPLRWGNGRRALQQQWDGDQEGYRSGHISFLAHGTQLQAGIPAVAVSYTTWFDSYSFEQKGSCRGIAGEGTGVYLVFRREGRLQLVGGGTGLPRMCYERYQIVGFGHSPSDAEEPEE
jgi:hypothetical protein